MSLNQLAKTVESQGRGKDTMLVHMSPREVAGLQALAMAHGGSLSTNPNTGLPEAGFLEDILPVVAAGALTAMTAGAAAPAVAGALNVGLTTGGLLAGAGIGALVGGGMSALQGGDFGKGALTGGLTGALGGYGAAGGFEGLFGSTAATVAPETGAAVTGSDILTQAGAGAATAPSATTAAMPDVTSQAVGMGGQFTPAAGMPANQFQVTGPAFGGDVEAQLGGFYGGRPPTPAEFAQTVPMAPRAEMTAAGLPAPQQKGFELFGYNISPGQAAVGLGGIGLLGAMMPSSSAPTPEDEDYTSPLKRISPNFKGYVPPQPQPYYRAQYPTYAAQGGVVALAGGGPVERMSMTNMGQGMYPQGMIDRSFYSTPSQIPSGMKSTVAYDQTLNPMFGTPQSMAKGGISDLGSYSDGGRLLRGPGDGVSDSIPAQIGERQPARLADGEFVVPARIVSELGNGSTEAGARKLYAMMDRVQSARRKSMKKGKHAVDSKAEKLLPA